MECDERRVFAAEIRSVERDGRFVEGVAAPYNVEAPIGSQFVETLAPGVFAKSIKEAARGLPLHTFHDSSTFPVGKSVEWRDTDDSLYGVWEFDTSAEATRAWEAASNGFVNHLSVGFQPVRSDVQPGTETKPTRVTQREARLVEVSMVTAPAYPDAVITLVRTMGPRMSRPHFDRWRRWADRIIVGEE